MSVSTLTPLEVALDHIRCGVFSINQEGRVWRHRHLRWNTVLDPPQRAETPVGNYLTVSVWLDGRVRSIKCHQLIWVYFNGPIPEGLEVDHIDEVGTHNHPSNLQVIPHSENIRLGYERRGEWRFGMRLPRNDVEKVNEMKALFAAGWSLRAIGRWFGVAHGTMRYLVHDLPSTHRVTSGGRCYE